MTGVSPLTWLPLISFYAAVVLAPVPHLVENYARISQTQTWEPPSQGAAALGDYGSGTQAQTWVGCNTSNTFHTIHVILPRRKFCHMEQCSLLHMMGYCLNNMHTNVT